MKTLIFLALLFISIQNVYSQVKWPRLTYRGDPATTISVGWTGVSATLYYDTIDHGTNYAQYAFSSVPDRSSNHKGNDHRFVHLSNLEAGTVYYFVIQYNVSATTGRYSFRTISDDPNQPISFISGGDSRQKLSFLGLGDPPCWGNGCRATRQDLNKIVARTRPDFVAFTGDYIRNFDVAFVVDSEDDWDDWFDDWDLATGPDNRLTPIIHSLGNHEDAADLDKLFDVSNTDIYYATNFGGNLFRFYTLNSEPSDACADVIQKNWFINDLQQNSTTSNTPHWKIVQYHQPMVPHANYSARTDLINCWARHFEQYGVRLACESHAHVMKTTYPLVYDDTASNSYNKLVRKDTTGAVFIGDGSWGAPPRPAYAPIPNVTRDVESTSGFFFVNVNQQRIKVQGIIPYPDSIVNITQLLDDTQGSPLAAGTPLWSVPNGSDCIIIPNYNYTSITKIEKERKNIAIIAPNPATDFVTIKFKEELKEDITIEIYDARGKKCRSYSNIREQNYQIDVSNLCSGVNFINILTKNDVQSYKLILVR